MKTFLVVVGFLLGLASCASNETYQDYRLLLKKATRSSCTTSGKTCSDCTHVVTCISDGEGGFIETPTELCNGEETCLIDRCTTDPNPRCEGLLDLDFVCMNSGIFPDQFDCQKYHFCVPDVSGVITNYDARCADSVDVKYGYHAGTTFCQNKLLYGVCSEFDNVFPVPICEEAGQSAALLENPTLFYICAEYTVQQPVLYPFLHACPHGGFYDNYQCVPRFP